MFVSRSKIAAVLLCSFLVTCLVKLQSAMQRELISSLRYGDQSTQLETQKEDDFSIPEDYDASFHLPGWKCSSPSSSSPSSSRNKLIFIHVFKTAGSTFRTFFDNYGEQCGKGVTTIIHCSDLTSASLNTKNPNKVWKPNCTIKKTLTRSKEVILAGRKVTRSHLQKYTDIAIGHMPYGLQRNWIVKSTEEPVIPQYITFFREPFTKYVSGRLFVHQKKRWTLKQAVSSIKKDIRNYYTHGKYYNGYIKYLTTPDEKKFGEKHKTSEGQWTRLVKKNIIETHTIVGVVELMSDSLELIQSVIDVDREQTKSFEQMINPQGSKSLVQNQSKLSSSKIVSILKEDEEVSKMFHEILKYEFEIYEFAVKVHKLQVEELRKQHGDRYSLASS